MSQPNNVYASGTTTTNADTTSLLKFAMQSMMLNVNTAYAGKIISINQSANKYAVQPIVNPLSTTGQPLTAPIIYDVPSVIVSGASAGVIIDYVVGDIVLVVCFSRDSTNAVKNQGVENPASSRKFSIADSCIVGKIPTSLPTTYVHIKSDGDVEVHGTNVVTNCTNSTVNCTTSTTNATTANVNASTIKLGNSAANKVLLQGVSLTANIGGVAAGGGVSGVPVTITAGGSNTTLSAL